MKRNNAIRKQGIRDSPRVNNSVPGLLPFTTSHVESDFLLRRVRPYLRQSATSAGVARGPAPVR